MLDQINGAFELTGGLIMTLSIRQAYKDKEVKGVSIPASLFFMTWAAFGTFYYPSLDQWYSFAGSVVLAMTNMIWGSQLIYYGWIKKKETP